MPPLPCAVVGEAQTAVNTKALSRRGRERGVHNPPITAPLLWFTLLKLSGGGFFFF